MSGPECDGGACGERTLSNREFVRSRVAKHEVPRLIEFVTSLPMTTTGKIMRRELRELEKQRRSA